MIKTLIKLWKKWKKKHHLNSDTILCSNINKIKELFMTIKNKSIKVLLDNIGKAKVILETQEKSNYFPAYVLMIKEEIKEMQEEIKKRRKK